MNLNNSKGLQDFDIPIKTTKVNLDILWKIYAKSEIDPRYTPLFEKDDQTWETQKTIINSLNLTKVLEKSIYNNEGN